MWSPGHTVSLASSLPITSYFATQLMLTAKSLLILIQNVLKWFPDLGSQPKI